MNDSAMNSGRILTPERIREMMHGVYDRSANPFVEILRREGFTPQDEVLMIIPEAWLESELRPWLVEPLLEEKWMKLSRHVDQAYIFNERVVRENVSVMPFRAYVDKSEQRSV